MLWSCVFTVFSETYSSPAISWFDSDDGSRRRTASSRSLSFSTSAGHRRGTAERTAERRRAPACSTPATAGFGSGGSAASQVTAAASPSSANGASHPSGAAERNASPSRAAAPRSSSIAA